MTNTDLEIVPAEVLPSDLSITRAPEIVIQEARNAARALKDIIDQKKDPVIFNKERYLEYEDWQLVARFYKVTAKVTETRFVQYGDVVGFAATAEAILLTPNGPVVISGAEAMCLNDEPKWSTRPKYKWQDNPKTQKRERIQIGEEAVPLFQLMSMSQTRACAKVLRNVFSCIVVLAGYKPTPAEEMTGNETFGGDPGPAKPASRKAPMTMPERKAAPAPPPPPPPTSNPANGATRPAASSGGVISDGRLKRWFAIWRSAGVPEDIVKSKLAEYGFGHHNEIQNGVYDELCTWAENFGRDFENEPPSDYDDRSY